MTDESRNDDRLDLNALRPSADAARVETRFNAITRDAMAARARRAPHIGVARALATSARPALLAAAIVLAVAIPTLALTYRMAPTPAPLPPTDALGIPRPLALILHSTHEPSLSELHDAVLGSAP
jgi:hypothetical protein